jgi:hypothetical protein
MIAEGSAPGDSRLCSISEALLHYSEAQIGCGCPGRISVETLTSRQGGASEERVASASPAYSAASLPSRRWVGRPVAGSQTKHRLGHFEGIASLLAPLGLIYHRSQRWFMVGEQLGCISVGATAPVGPHSADRPMKTSANEDI